MFRKEFCCQKLFDGGRFNYTTDYNSYVCDTIAELAIAILPDYRGQGIETDLLM